MTVYEEDKLEVWALNLRGRGPLKFFGGTTRQPPSPGGGGGYCGAGTMIRLVIIVWGGLGGDKDSGLRIHAF